MKRLVINIIIPTLLIAIGLFYLNSKSVSAGTCDGNINCATKNFIIGGGYTCDPPFSGAGTCNIGDVTEQQCFDREDVLYGNCPDSDCAVGACNWEASGGGGEGGCGTCSAGGCQDGQDVGDSCGGGRICIATNSTC